MIRYVLLEGLLRLFEINSEEIALQLVLERQLGIVLKPADTMSKFVKIHHLLSRFGDCR